jgi:hypothetical protein
MSAERSRLAEADQVPWRLWGPYLSERQWGTVREDYSSGGAAWDFFPHDHARSRVYRWGEDGLAGISDQKQRLCFSLALWNGYDPILKERLFGLTNGEGNHGEDIKEYHFYLDCTPTHSYMKVLYKYPHQAFPYLDLIVENARRKADPRSFEYELLDTGVFANDRYSDVVVEYAKKSPTDILVRISVTNRGPEAKAIHVLPTLWYRNTWSWEQDQTKPSLSVAPAPDASTLVIRAAEQHGLGPMWLYCQSPQQLLFCENETNFRRLFGSANGTSYPKDAINDYIASGNRSAVNPAQTGSKAAAHYAFSTNSRQTKILLLRLTSEANLPAPFRDFADTFAERIREADEFYGALTPAGMSVAQRAIQRQALSGMLWSKQFYHYVVEDWLQGDPAFPPPPPQRSNGRNKRWMHFYTEDVLSMPDKWEYPWFASWDSCFHTIPLTLVDPAFARQQLELLANEWYMNPDGQVPAYEWAFDDVNPPVHPWAAWRIYKIEKKMTGQGDIRFLENIFQRCLLYFTWWVNRKDAKGDNLFSGGFLGLDNIGVFDRNQLPPGASIAQADGTSWMGLFALVMLKIALELAAEEAQYNGMAVKFFQHFVYIADALNQIEHRLDAMSAGQARLWDEQDGFFYDVLRTADGRLVPMKVRSLVGLMPLIAIDTLDESVLTSVEHSQFHDRILWFIQNHPELTAQVTRVQQTAETLSFAAQNTRRFRLSLVDEHRLRRILSKMLDEDEFLGPHGIRSVSKYHQQHPYTLDIDGRRYVLDYAAAESTTQTFGGNSNWRGPVWFPINFLLIESLQKFHHCFGPSFKVECPTGSGNQITLWEVASEISQRLIKLFEPGPDGRRPIYGGIETLQSNEHWKDHILFYEYFHGDNGAGLGASHQTGWTGLVAKLLQQQAEFANRPVPGP